MQRVGWNSMMHSATSVQWSPPILQTVQFRGCKGSRCLDHWRSRLFASQLLRSSFDVDLHFSGSLWRNSPQRLRRRVSAINDESTSSSVPEFWSSTDCPQLDFPSTSGAISNVERDTPAGISESKLGIFIKFVDEQLLRILHNSNSPVHQTVLLTDGMDTRIHRLLWPSPSLIFNVLPGDVHNVTSKMEIDTGPKAPNSCLVQYISFEFSQEDFGDGDLAEKLVSKGFRGGNLSAWVIQMTVKMSGESLRRILAVAGGLLKKGSMFLGIITIPLVGTHEFDALKKSLSVVTQVDTLPLDEAKASLRKLFAGHGFSVELHTYEELASRWSLEDTTQLATTYQDLPFVFIAQQQRLSDAQVEIGRAQMELAEEVDEEGFEDTW